ncbi:unnamed protein product, partial [Polarella glacialis]
AVGGATGVGLNGEGPTTYLGQAWAWDHQLSPDEVKSLYLATRTRYYPNYEADIRNGQVVTSGQEVKVSGRLGCPQPGCSSTITLSGLPTTAATICKLTVDVVITDYSNPNEVVEFINIDGFDVIKNCWPGKDNAPSELYRCADQVDVSQEVLGAAFLNDGKVVVTAKISDEVNQYRAPSKWFLEAFVE